MNVLIVEDEKSMSRFFQDILEPFAIEMRCACTIGEAIETLHEMNHVDLIILDLKLPDSSPENTARHIVNLKAVHPECAVMVVSGMLWEESLIDKCRQYGADVVTPKNPIDCRRDALLTGFLQAVKARKTTEPDTPDFIHRIELLEAAVAGNL